MGSAPRSGPASKAGADKAPASKVYAWPGVGIRVECDTAHRRWLDEFLEPSFGASAGDTTECSVRLVEDPARFEAVLSGGPTGTDLNAFVLDSRILKLPGWTTDGGRSVLDEEYSVLYRTDPSGSRVEILQPAFDLFVRNPLMRVVRELAMNHARRAGTLFLHAACVSLGGRGLIIAAPKGGGKTTLLIHAMRAPSARYVGNDRVGVFRVDGGAELRGVPVIVCLREEALRFAPGLRDRLIDGWYRWELTLDECRSRPGAPPRPWLDGRYGITPAQFCALVERPRVDRVAPAAVVFAELTGQRGTVRLVPLSEDETAARLRRSVFGAAHLGACSDLFDPQRLPIREDRMAESCAELARRVQGYRCLLGTDVRSESIAHELEAVLAR